jgi:hypothetical protein
LKEKEKKYHEIEKHKIKGYLEEIESQRDKADKKVRLLSDENMQLFQSLNKFN